MVSVCSGSISYSSVSGVVENIVRTFVYVKKIRVPDMDDHDVSQEIRIKCWEAVNSSTYDPTRLETSLYSYLKASIHNHLYNLRRGIVVPNNAPCNRCNFWNKKDKRCVRDEDMCVKMQKYRRTMSVKLALKNPVGYDVQYIESSRSDVCQAVDIDQIILNEYILKKLPNHFISYYEKASSGEYVAQEIMDELQSVVVEILEEEKSM